MVEFSSLDFPCCELGENARWNPVDGRFYFTDILHGTIYSADSSFRDVRTELETEYQTGAFLITKSGDILLLTEKGLVMAERSGRGFSLGSNLLSFEFEDGERFNDATADPEGRILAGIKKADNVDGRLVSIERDGSWRVLLDNLKISNGLGFSPDGSVFYHTDSGYKTIRAYRYDHATGSLYDGRIFFSAFPDDGEPDGLAIDRNGNVWTALWGAGMIYAISPDGTKIAEYKVNAGNVSSVAFGGVDMHTLIATSACCGLEVVGEGDGKCYYAQDNIFEGSFGYLV